MAEDYYDLLGITPTADAATRERATRARIAELREAFEALAGKQRDEIDPELAKRYSDLLGIAVGSDRDTVKAAANKAADRLRMAHSIANDPDRRNDHGVAQAQGSLNAPTDSVLAGPANGSSGRGLVIAAAAIMLGLTLAAPSLHASLLPRFRLPLVASIIVLGLVWHFLRLPRRAYAARRSRFFNGGSMACWAALILPSILLLYQTQTTTAATALFAAVAATALALSAGLLGGTYQALVHRAAVGSSRAVAVGLDLLLFILYPLALAALTLALFGSRFGV